MESDSATSRQTTWTTQPPSKELCLLALDGGGVRGLSALHILKQLMELVDSENPPKPCDYFDLIGGTSTGGLIAIMLGRLQMSVDECIYEYKKLSTRVFTKVHHRINWKGNI
jgi:patatin-like phospholipase/acyl hydrolase